MLGRLVVFCCDFLCCDVWFSNVLFGCVVFCSFLLHFVMCYILFLRRFAVMLCFSAFHCVVLCFDVLCLNCFVLLC